MPDPATSGEPALWRAANADDHADAAPTRVLIENIYPLVGDGIHAAKRCVGDQVRVEADLVVDGHEKLAGRVLYRGPDDEGWRHVWLEPGVNDRWHASFSVDTSGYWQYTVEAWVDAFGTWREAFIRKHAAGQDVAVDRLVGAQLLIEVAERVSENAEALFRSAAEDLESAHADEEPRVQRALETSVATLARKHPDPATVSRYHRALELVVERERAVFGAWYELFPRSWGPPHTHGTFRQCAERLDYVQSMGFDVLYLPPIHPIGETFRKGPNNSLEAKPGDPGSPWAIGAKEGGHKSVHPQLGSLEDFRWFVEQARGRDLEIALDIALQVSPDHPYVREHPEWFVMRPDGTIQYAENPPKKYQDIYPFNFQCADWQALWQELLSIFLFWVDQGVRIFRVDNPHTKALAFWAWCIREVRRKDPEVIFLSEAFTRPKLMYALAKLGFSQSYTYFTWRNTKHELVEYMRELVQAPVRDFFRPNFWPNTPDILPENLQYGGRPTFVTRLVLASTLSSNYGIYGPAFELMDHEARPGSGEYLNNEKFELKSRDLGRADSLRPLIARINRIRRDNPALSRNDSLCFHPIDNEALVVYSKRCAEPDNVVLVVVNLDPHHTQSGWVTLDLDALGLEPEQSFQVHDQVSDERYLWSGDRAYVQLDPHVMPTHLFVLRRHVRSEHDFDYFA